MEIDWDKLVREPASKGYYAQAFAGADSIIDDMGELLLRKIFNSFEAQTLINHLHGIRGRVNFDGLVIFLILEKKDVIDQNLYKEIKQFKEARNLVLHNKEAEYKLLEYSEMTDTPDQADYDEKVRSKANTYLASASGVFRSLLDRVAIIHGHEKEFLMKGLGSPKRRK